eukprot:TRINITY_DN3882_c0_g1_i8.p1 TRINITY_DN3882_c0_g1~~TRINITY_DN3882_c0_g1_i8.p1  ORF type:complete len:294 (+),score=54.23 TRINITY_DN3882_c0_g1_i8:61-942(+)
MQWPRCFFAVAVLAAVGLAAVVCQPASAPPQPHPPPHRPPLPPASASIGLVVAAHSGAASWLDEFKYSTDVWVYSKGRTCTPFSKRGLRCVPLANYGREGASYLHHIVSRWDDLAELTVFAQEEPQEHSPDFLTLVRTFISNSSFASLAEVGGALPLTDRFRDVAVPGPIPPREQRELLRVPSAGHCRVYTETRDREMVPVGPHAFSYSKGDLQKVIRRWRKDHKVPSGESTLDFIWRHFEFGRPPAPSAYTMAYSGVFAATRLPSTIPHRVSCARRRFGRGRCPSGAAGSRM